MTVNPDADCWDGREHGYPRTALLELARQMRQASSARPLGGLGLVGGA